MTSPDMDDEAMKAMARRIAEASRINGPLGLGPPDAYRAALAAIIETTEAAATFAERIDPVDGPMFADAYRANDHLKGTQP